MNKQIDVPSANIGGELILNTGDVIELSGKDVAEILRICDKQAFGEEDYD